MPTTRSPYVVAFVGVAIVAGLVVLEQVTRPPPGCASSSSQTPAPSPVVDTCFTPDEDCTSLIVNTLGTAQRTVRVLAYSFTSPEIGQALAAAKACGVDVRVVLDKSQRSSHSDAVTALRNAGVPIQIDELSGIAHNKVMEIDESVVITGSFNFTKSAQKRNAENLVIIRDQRTASRFLANWSTRSSHAKDQ